MKIENEISNQWRILHKIYNNRNETFDWEDMKLAIEALVNMKKIKVDPYYFDR